MDLRPAHNLSSTAVPFDLKGTHVFRESGKHFLFDSSSLAVVQVAQEVFEFIEIAQKRSTQAASADLVQRYGAARAARVTSMVSEMTARRLLDRVAHPFAPLLFAKGWGCDDPSL